MASGIPTQTSGQVEGVEGLGKRGAGIESEDRIKKTSLMVASEQGNDQVVESVLEFINNVDTRDEKGRSALMKACENGHKNVVDILIRHGADVNATTPDKNAWTPLWFAVKNRLRVDIAELLLDKGAVVDQPVAELDERQPWTVLMEAVRAGDEKMVEVLLNHGADVCKTSINRRALRYAVMSREPRATKVVELLIRHGADVNDRFEESSPYTTFLLVACLSMNKNLVQLLVENGANVNAEYKDGPTIVDVICNHQCFNEEVLQVLVDNGLDLNVRDEHGETILMRSCTMGFYDFVELLLQHGVDIDVCNYERSSAAMNAISFDNIDCLKLLVEAGADLDLVDNRGRSVLHCAVSSRMFADEKFHDLDCLNVLLKEGVLLKDGKIKSDHRNRRGYYCTPNAIRRLIDGDLFEWNFCNHDRYKPICFAALEAGICPGEIEYKDKLRSPLILAFLENDLEAIEKFTQHLYFFPEDYSTLTTDGDVRANISNTSALEELALQPMSLFAWSFLSVSKVISQAGHPTRRCQRVDALQIPTAAKRRLKFQLGGAD